MKLCGITNLSQATPALLNTADIEYLVPSSIGQHPWITWKGHSSRLRNDLTAKL